MVKNQNNLGIIPNNSDKNPVNISQQKNRLAGNGFWTPLNHELIQYRQLGILDVHKFSAAVMLLCYCNKNQLKFNFEMSRRELAAIANCNKEVAEKTLATLVRFGLLIEVFKRKGCHSKYAWNVDNFNGGEKELKDLTATWSGTCPSDGHDLPVGRSGPAREVGNTCIRFLEIIFLKRLHDEKTAFVENVENHDDAADAASIFEFARTSWSDAIKKCSRAYGYDRVYLIVKFHEVKFLEVHEPTKTLSSLCRNSGLISELRTLHGHFKSDKEFTLYAKGAFDLVLKDFNKINFSESSQYQ